MAERWFFMEGKGLMSQNPPAHLAAQRTPPAIADGSTTGLSLESLILAHHATVFRYAFRLSGSAVDAEDLTQQTFLIAQQKLHQLRELERAAGWLVAIARTTFLKSRAKRVPIPCDGELEEAYAPGREILELDSQELQQVLGELPPDLRLTLVMFYFEDLSYQEIANELEIPIGTVMSRLSRAKQRLRQRLGVQESPSVPSRTPRTKAEEKSVASRSTHTAP